MALKEIQRKLNTPQHVLIHLCEKGVIEPDVQQTQGRGIRRQFSSRNLFEFIVALTIRKYGIPVTTTAAVVRLLRSFERSTQQRVKGFGLLRFLQRSRGRSNIVLRLYDGQYMVFGIETDGQFKSITGFDLERILSRAKKPIKIDQLSALPEDYDSHLELDLGRLAAKAA